jgi:protein-S-isoprenylcysteine O-methyltransferase Ste14
MRLGGAVLLAGIGLGICVVGVAAFRKAKTTVNPVQAHNASSLVRHGIYRYTRNPMYLGMLLVLAGWAAFLANPGALVFLPLFVGFMNRFQIQPEERILASLFGVEYASYLAQVRRWL